jgi:hypothetical protein
MILMQFYTTLMLPAFACSVVLGMGAFLGFLAVECTAWHFTPPAAAAPAAAAPAAEATRLVTTRFVVLAIINTRPDKSKSVL